MQDKVENSKLRGYAAGTSKVQGRAGQGRAEQHGAMEGGAGQVSRVQ